MADEREPFHRFALRGIAISVALVAAFIVVVLLIMFVALPEGWNT